MELLERQIQSSELQFDTQANRCSFGKPYVRWADWLLGKSGERLCPHRPAAPEIHYRLKVRLQGPAGDGCTDEVGPFLSHSFGSGAIVPEAVTP